MSKRFRPNLKKPPKKTLECPNCSHEHNHKMNVNKRMNGQIDGYVCHNCGQFYSRPYEPSVYVFDHVSGAITVVTP